MNSGFTYGLTALALVMTAPSFSYGQEVKELIVAAPVTPVAVPLNQPSPVTLQLTQRPEGLPSDVRIDGVSFTGFTRYVAVEGQKIGQVVLTEVKKGDQKVALDTTKFEAQFDIRGDATLTNSSPVKIDGDQAALEAALRQLQTAKAEPEPKETAEKEEQQQQQAQSGSQATGYVPSGSSEGQGISYKTPERLAATAEDDTTPVPDTKSTTEGCDFRPDTNREVVFQQSRIETKENGIVTDPGTCADSFDTRPLKRNYKLCNSYETDFDNKKAWPKFQWSYLNNEGEVVPYGKCIKDEDKEYTIVEKHSGCDNLFDYETGVTTPQSQWVFEGLNNKEELVKDCNNSATKPPITMKPDTSLCEMDHDFPGKKSTVMAAWTYVEDNQAKQATSCLATETTYGHTIYYKDEQDLDLCTPINENGTITLLYRIGIVVSGQRQYISECKPADGGPQAIQTTEAGCKDPSLFEHNIGALKSYGRDRSFYMDAVTGQPRYLTSCQKSTTITYDHTQTTTDWDKKDEQKGAYPKKTVTITVDGQPYTIKDNEVLAGAELVPYEYLEVNDVDDQTSYDGCTKITTTRAMEDYERPDGTIFKFDSGAGTPKSDNACTQVSETRGEKQATGAWAVQGKNQLEVDENGQRWSMTCTRTDTYQWDVVWQRDDGAQINTHYEGYDNTPYFSNHIWQPSAPDETTCATLFGQG